MMKPRVSAFLVHSQWDKTLHHIMQSVVVKIIACSKDSYSDSMTRCGGEFSNTPHVSGALSDRSVAVRVDDRPG
jgi:hypothetical protein